jgi:hypothetical protein
MNISKWPELENGVRSQGIGANTNAEKNGGGVRNKTKKK